MTPASRHSKWPVSGLYGASKLSFLVERIVTFCPVDLSQSGHGWKSPVSISICCPLRPSQNLTRPRPLARPDVSLEERGTWDLPGSGRANNPHVNHLALSRPTFCCATRSFIAMVPTVLFGYLEQGFRCLFRETASGHNVRSSRDLGFVEALSGPLMLGGQQIDALSSMNFHGCRSARQCRRSVKGPVLLFATPAIFWNQSPNESVQY